MALMTAFRPKGEAIYRHRLVTRLCHWTLVLAMALLLMSGLQIFNAHPRLYWGQYGANADPALLELGATQSDAGEIKGFTQIGPWTFPTTGLLGASRAADGSMDSRGFPRWITLPREQDLAAGRRWHFLFAWLLAGAGTVYLTFGALSRHFQRDLFLTGEEIEPRHLLHDVWDHLRFRQPTGEAAKRYNTLQKAAYLAVIFALVPLMVATGLTMSPGMDSAFPWLLDLFGGRQSARTIHFVTANLIVLFVIVHLFEVLIAGAWNEVRSMITGWYLVRQPKAGGGS